MTTTPGSPLGTRSATSMAHGRTTMGSVTTASRGPWIPRGEGIVHYGPGDRPICGEESGLAVHTEDPHQATGCDECLDLVAEDLSDTNQYAGHCLHCKETISAVGGVAWRRVIHVFDRGFAGAPWLRELCGRQLRFIVRWPTRYRLSDAKGERPAWQITRGKRSQDHRQIWDTRRRQHRKAGIVAVPVSHPQLDDELWLVVSRPGRGRTPWYLLTNEPVSTNDDAWRVVLAYARRWQVEMCYRACKTDLAMGEPKALVLGKPAQTAAHGRSGLCLPALPAGP